MAAAKPELEIDISGMDDLRTKMVMAWKAVNKGMAARIMVVAESIATNKRTRCPVDSRLLHDECHY